MSEKKRQYIVLWRGYSPMLLGLYRDGPRHGVLFIGLGVTVFPSHQSASRAVRRTVEFMQRSDPGHQGRFYNITKLSRPDEIVSAPRGERKEGS